MPLAAVGAGGIEHAPGSQTFLEKEKRENKKKVISHNGFTFSVGVERAGRKWRSTLIDTA